MQGIFLVYFRINPIDFIGLVSFNIDVHSLTLDSSLAKFINRLFGGSIESKNSFFNILGQVFMIKGKFFAVVLVFDLRIDRSTIWGHIVDLC